MRRAISSVEHAMIEGFTAHNIEFPDGSRTRDNEELLANMPWCRSAIRTLRILYGRDLKGKRIADLGCLEGGYALEFARIGMESVGVEVRPSNFKSCQTVKERSGLSNLQFFQDDVWNIEKYGPFDVIFCSGLLYHLDRPREFLRLLSKITKDAILLNTHYAPQKMFDKEFGLSEMAEHEGFPGRWYPEHDLKISQRDALDQLKWTSWENKKSFWLTREAIAESLRENGFDTVFEQHDAAGDHLLHALTSLGHLRYHRAMFVGVRP